MIEEAIFGYYFPLVDNIVPDQDSSSSILKVILQGFDHSKVENRRKLQFYSTSAVEDGAGAQGSWFETSSKSTNSFHLLLTLFLGNSWSFSNCWQFACEFLGQSAIQKYFPQFYFVLNFSTDEVRRDKSLRTPFTRLPVWFESRNIRTLPIITAYFLPTFPRRDRNLRGWNIR